MTAAIPVPVDIETEVLPPMRWMLLPRHYRRVFGAASRAAICDERGNCDDWVLHWLKRTRHEALRVGHTLDEVNDWTMEGCLHGRREAHAPLKVE